VTRLTYRDAVKILGGGNSPLVSALDKVFGGLLLGATPLVPDLLSIFDAKSELARLTHELVAKGIDRRHRLSQFDRIQRLHAARGVLMVVAEGTTSRDALRGAKQVLQEMNLLGVVLNRSETQDDGAYYSYAR